MAFPKIGCKLEDFFVKLMLNAKYRNKLTIVATLWKRRVMKSRINCVRP